MGYLALMTLLLSHTSALEALRRLGEAPDLRREAGSPIRLSAGLPAADRVLEACGKALGPEPTLPIHLLVSDTSSKPRNASLVAHPSRIEPDGDSAFWLGDVACLSPARLCTQMAATLSDLELTLLLFELMGTYSLRTDVARGMAGRHGPLLTRAELLSYLERHKCQPCVTKVRRCLGYAFEGSASPRESKLALRLSLKPALGGYGLKVAGLNVPIDAQTMASRQTKTRRSDVLLANPPDASKLVALEYDGADHLDGERHAEDLRRTNELKAAGIAEYRVDKDLYANSSYMDALVASIRSDLGMPAQRLTRAEAERRRGLRRTLYDELEAIGRAQGKRTCGRRDTPAGGEVSETMPTEEVPLEAYGA